MSLKDAIEKSRAGLAYGTVLGQNVSNFGQISGITDQFSKDMSNISMDKIGRDFSTAGKGIANLAVNAFNEVTTTVQDAIEFATNPYGGVTDKDFSGMMSSRDDQSSGTQQISDMTQYDNTVGIASLDSIEKSKADEAISQINDMFSSRVNSIR